MVLALLAMATVGCRSQRETAHTTPTTPVIDPTAPPAYAPQYYTANFTCTTQGITAKGQLRLQADSVLWAYASKIV